ncbi:MAG: TetR family transcriptional regulator [Bifidobacteriaceae bacterium]|nr:TetR family transcriptional regulator [Bifidobacteriaceae bacterium]
MPRWDPDARERLIAAALQLFAERGYDHTTVSEVAERAGLAKSTFFRYFPDKRDALTAGQETLSRLLVEGIAQAPDGATPLAAIGGGLTLAASAMTPFTHELGPGLLAVIAANVELQERDALKHVGMTAAMAGALRQRGVGEPAATLAAELGGLAFKEAYATWIGADGLDLGELARAALDRLHAAAATLD